MDEGDVSYFHSLTRNVVFFVLVLWQPFFKRVSMSNRAWRGARGKFFRGVFVANMSAVSATRGHFLPTDLSAVHLHGWGTLADTGHHNDSPYLK